MPTKLIKTTMDGKATCFSFNGSRTQQHIMRNIMQKNPDKSEGIGIGGIITPEFSNRQITRNNEYELIKPYVSGEWTGQPHQIKRKM